MRICVTYEEMCTHSERESGRFGSWSESYSSNVTGAYCIDENEQTPYESETFIVPDDATDVFVVYMIYSTGNSFGHADGKIDIIHCTANEESADKLAKYITENSQEYSIKFTDDFGREISLYNPGAGYFERITYVGVEHYSLGTGKSKKRYYVN